MNQKDPLWDLVSEYVRRSNSDQYGFVRCFTCWKRLKWTEAHGGHYIGRYHGATRYHLDNLRVQCHTCNCELDGNTEVFRRLLIADIGLNAVERIEALSRTVSKLSKRDKLEQIEHYKQLVTELKKSKNIAA